MASERDRETFGAKLWLLVIDKLLLGLIVLLLGHWLDVRLAELNHSLDLNLQTAYADLERSQSLAEQRKKTSPEDRAVRDDKVAAWNRTHQAFVRLDATIRNLLQLDGIIVG